MRASSRHQKRAEPQPKANALRDNSSDEQQNDAKICSQVSLEQQAEHEQKLEKQLLAEKES